MAQNGQIYKVFGYLGCIAKFCRTLATTVAKVCEAVSEACCKGMKEKCFKRVCKRGGAELKCYKNVVRVACKGVLYEWRAKDVCVCM